jgi:protein-S-isoprenylcysteine O-methyltransferase Ste14
MPDEHTPATRDAIVGWLFVAAQFVLLGLLAFEAWRATSPAGLRVVGGLAVLCGAAILSWGSSRLGRELRTHPAPSPTAVLRVDGAFRFVRHPIYSGLLLLAAGLTLSAASALAVAEWVTLLALLTQKARFEERLLAERFEGYREYASRTPRFVPRLARLRR